MNIEFHYYVTKYLALEAGFDSDEAEIIAYSSQYVDDNCFQFQIETPRGDLYQNYISQTRNILKPENKLMRIYLLFHFLPGNPTSSKVQRMDGKMHLLMTTAGSNHASEIFYEATKSENLYSLGIASHMLSDTYAHQGFTGTRDEINSMRGSIESLIPDIGHADAGMKPDIPNLIWTDHRLIRDNQMINNPDRILLAARKLYNNYLLITSNENRWNKVKHNIAEIISGTIEVTQLSQEEGQRQGRIEEYKHLLAQFGENSDYDKKHWLDQAVEQDVKFLGDKKITIDPIKEKFTFKPNYHRSHWFKFQEAVKAYQKLATNKLQPLLYQLEIDEW